MDKLKEGIAFKDILREALGAEDLDAIIRDKLLEHKRAQGNASTVPAFVEYQMGGGTATFQEFSAQYSFGVSDEEVLSFKTDNYADLRKASYPPLADLADALVKGDESQLDAYKQACLAVKQRFPKS